MVKRDRIGLLSICYLLHIHSLFGQPNPVQFEHINIEDGLSQGSVYCVLQDRKGFLWFGTQDGLNKYDGYEFTVYRHNKYDTSSLSDNCINAIHEDRSGNLWIGTLSGGLNRLDRLTNEFTSYQALENNSASLSSNTISCIFQDRSGKIWVGTDDGLNLMEGENFVRFYHDPVKPSSISGNSITCIYEDSQANLWVGTTSGLNRYDPGTQTFRRYALHQNGDHGKHSHISSIYEDERGNLFVGTHGEGLFLRTSSADLNAPPDIRQVRFAGIEINEVSSVLSDPEGNIWIGFQEEGLVCWNPRTDARVHIRANPVQSSSLSNDRVSALFFDKFGNLWVGTLNGINKLNLSNRKFNAYQNRPGIQGDIRNSIFAIAKDEEGNIWTGTRGGLFVLTKKQEVKEYRHRPGTSARRVDAIRSIYSERSGRLWIGTEKGTLETVNTVTGTFRAMAIDPRWRENPVYEIRQDASDMLWLGTLEGLYSVDPASGRIRHYDWQNTIQAGTRRREIRSIEIDHAGNLWIGTRGAGLLYFDRNKEAFVSYLNNPSDSFSISSNVIASIYIDKAMNRIWIGTASGFNKFIPEEKKFYSYTERDGLPNDVVYGVLPDDDGFLWLSTNNGIVKFDPESETFRTYDASDGLQGSEFNAGAYYKSRDGELFFGGINGYNSFYPREVTDNAQLPEIVLTGFKVFNEDINLPTSPEYTDSINLTYKDDVFSLEFSALHLTAPEKNRYAYMLEGFDQDWVFTQRRFATYTNLDPGRYTFRVRATNNDGIWNEAGLSVIIFIKPPFWQTWWFYVMATLMAGSLIGAVYRFRVGQIRREEKLKTEFNKKLAEVEMTALRAQMNPHFLFNCLNSINRFIVRSDAETASNYLTKFSRLIRLILQNSKAPTITLKSELEALRLYIEMEEMRFESRFDYTIKVDERVESEFVEVPPLLLQPYVENAIWHGLMHKESRGRLTVEITRDDGWLRCVVEDNGIGRQKAQQLKSKSATRDKSMGMKITTDRLNLYQKQTKVQVIDLMDSNGNPAGTRVVLGFPYALELQRSPMLS
ncbi:MAG TPA: two-component regulator propeller domain-containing protein [Cyclobacteriaceae bacterium]